jgi:hypothetical protein
MPDRVSVTAIIEEMASYGIPERIAEDIARELILAGKRSERAAQEEDRRREWREKIAEDDGPIAVAAAIRAAVIPITADGNHGK